MEKMSEYQDTIATELNVKTVSLWKKIGGGCNDECWAYKTDVGEIFVKVSYDEEGKELLLGELNSLEALQQSEAIQVPRPIRLSSFKKATLLITDFVTLSELKCFQGELGQQLANLHLKNLNLLNENSPHAVKKFGFHVTSCCGKLPLDNHWNDDWVDFYCKQRLQPQVEMAAKKSGNKEVKKLWSLLEPKVALFFRNTTVYPSLLHGDLWSGNVGETRTGPVIFDPASFYGHHEFDLAITRMFGGFRSAFYQRYHQVIPQEQGFEERKPLYELFHYLNHWNHFGGGYESQSLKIMRLLVNSVK